MEIKSFTGLLGRVLPLQMTGDGGGGCRSSSTPAFSVRTVRGKVLAALEQSVDKPAKRRGKKDDPLSCSALSPHEKRPQEARQAVSGMAVPGGERVLRRLALNLLSSSKRLTPRSRSAHSRSRISASEGIANYG
jgi:hypothetical protein